MTLIRKFEKMDSGYFSNAEVTTIDFHQLREEFSRYALVSFNVFLPTMSFASNYFPKSLNSSSY